MPTTTKARTCYHVPAADLTDGQVLRDYFGRTLIVDNVRASLDADRISFDLTQPSTGIVVPLALGPQRTMVTYTDAALPGLDAATGRCCTCDSRGCGLICARPWVADRA